MAENDTGRTALDAIWWDVMDELHEIVTLAEDTANRIAAADTILRYMSTLNQGINAPFIPDTRPESDDVDDDE